MKELLDSACGLLEGTGARFVSFHELNYLHGLMPSRYETTA
jgi:hypothetical protein